MQTVLVKVIELVLDLGSEPRNEQLAIEYALQDQVIEIEVYDAKDSEEIHYEMLDAIESLTGYLISSLDYEVISVSDVIETAA